MVQHVALRCLVAAVWLWAPGCLAAVSNAALEYSVKAAFIYRFGGFVEWPAGAFASAESPTNLCIVGEDPFEGTLDKVVDGQRIAEHKVVITRMAALGEKSNCQILYVASRDEAVTSKILAAVRGQNVLTITDGARTPGATGIINFVIADNRVRFEIDDQAAAANGMTISSKLLDLARTAKRRS